MKNTEEIIKGLCTLLGAGFKGKVKYKLRSNLNFVSKSMTFDLIRFLGQINYLEAVYVTPKPFSDLLIKDSVGICDASRIAQKAYPPFFGPNAKCEADYGSITVISESDEMRFEFVILENYSMYSIKRVKDSGNYPRSLKVTDYALLYENGYLIPDALKKS